MILFFSNKKLASAGHEILTLFLFLHAARVTQFLHGHIFEQFMLIPFFRNDRTNNKIIAYRGKLLC
jgi:hypothetical protein